MSKEMIVAVLFGLIVGLFLTYGFYRARMAMSPNPTPVASPNPATNTLLAPDANDQLTILSPEDEIVQAKQSTTVTGKTLANAPVVILVNNDQEITTSDVNGNFSQERALRAGSNVIIVTVLDESGATIVAERTVIVANTAGLNPSPVATPSGQSTL